MRRPGEGRCQLGHEHQVLQITRVKLWPAVGRPAHFFFDDLADPFTEHWRLTTAAVSIEAVTGAKPWDPSPTEAEQIAELLSEVAASRTVHRPRQRREPDEPISDDD